MQKQNQEIQWAIVGIKELEFMVDDISESTTAIDFNYTVDLRPIVDKELVNIMITVNYSDQASKTVFMRGRVVTTYRIKDMKSMIAKLKNGNDAVDLPEPLWIAMFSIAFTHTRALLAKSSAGTKFGNLLLPAINPETEFRKLFGPHLEKMKESGRD